MYESPTEIIKRVGIYLGVAMPLGSKLQDHLQGVEATRLELAKAKVEWGQLLAEKRNQMLHPKDKDLTELDRKTMLDASVAVIQKDYDFLCKLEELVEQRIDLGKLLLTLAK